MLSLTSCARCGRVTQEGAALSRIGERATEWFEEVAQHRLALTQLPSVIPVVRIGDIESQVAQRSVEHFAEHFDMCIVDVEIHGSRLGRPPPVRKGGVEEFDSGEHQARGLRRMTSEAPRSVFPVRYVVVVVPTKPPSDGPILPGGHALPTEAGRWSLSGFGSRPMLADRSET